MKYRPEIDGLRALAVVPVILFHARFEPFSGGFVGVDVFLVISGYLITSLILIEQQAGRFSLLAFYERRARRILPALFLVMLACIPFAWLLLLPKEMSGFAGSLIAASASMSNIYFWRTTGYFGIPAETQPLLHTWSLGVEEQYYLIFPLCMMIAGRLDRRISGYLLAVGFLGSLALSEALLASDPDAAFYLLPTRAWELLLGALAACARGDDATPKGGKALKEAAGLTGLFMILVAVLSFSRDTPFPGVVALVPTLGAFLVIVCSSADTVAGRILSSAPLVRIGLISYSAYLLHYPIFAFARIAAAPKELGPISFSVLAIVSMGLAWVSWHCVERPFRERGRISTQGIVHFTLAGGILFASLGVAGTVTDGFESIFRNHRLSESDRLAYELIQNSRFSKMYDDGDCVFWTEATDDRFHGRFRDCERKYGPAVVILGDSHAMNVFNIFAKAGFHRFTVGLSQGGCRPHDAPPYCPYESLLAFAAEDPGRIRAVIFNQTGSALMRNAAGTLRFAFFGAVAGAGRQFEPDWPKIEAVESYLRKLGRIVPTVWLGPFPEARVSYRDPRIFRTGFHMDEQWLRSFDRLEIALAGEHMAASAPYRFVPFSAVIKMDRDFLKVGRCLTFRDQDHLSNCGEEIIARHLGPLRNELLPGLGTVSQVH